LPTLAFRWAAGLLLFTLAACTQVRPAPAPLNAVVYAADVRFLAADGQEGRGLATEGIHRASDYLVRSFAVAGLRPAFGRSYFQTFTAMVGAVDGARTFLAVGGVTLPRERYKIFGLSSPGRFDAGLVFAGYGITAPDLGYDDYAGIDVRGKVVVLLRYEPQETDATSRFDGTQWSEYATFRYKLFNAHRHGAAAVLLVTGPKVHDKQGDELVPLQSDPMAGEGFGLPMFHVARSALGPVLARAGVDLLAFQDAVDADLKPRSRPLDGYAAGWADIQRRTYTVSNVGAFLPGERTDRTIVFGAHYDHLGYGGPYAVSGPPDAIYHGADDNASGTAGLLALARWYAERRPPPVNLLFLGFSAEESGLVGSTYFVQHAPIDFDGVLAMLNMDMIGRLRNNTLTIFGTGTAAEFDGWIKELTPAGMSVVSKPEGFGPSDHAPFYGTGIPVLHFFTGSHDDYHKPSDTADLVNAEGGIGVVDFVRRAADRIATADRLAYRGPARPQTLFVGMEAGPGAPQLGVRPDFASAVSGVVVASLVKKSPAEGVLRPGDQILWLNGQPIANYYELAHDLRGRKPGDVIELVFMRGGRLERARLALSAAPRNL
jgi:hypothetical protein